MSYSYCSRFYARLSTVYRVAGNLNLVWNILNIICCSIHSVFFHSLNWLYVFCLRSTVLASANKESRWFWVLLAVDSRFVIWVYVDAYWRDHQIETVIWCACVCVLGKYWWMCLAVMRPCSEFASSHIFTMLPLWNNKRNCILLWYKWKYGIAVRKLHFQMLTGSSQIENMWLNSVKLLECIRSHT